MTIPPVVQALANTTDHPTFIALYRMANVLIAGKRYTYRTIIGEIPNQQNIDGIAIEGNYRLMVCHSTGILRISPTSSELPNTTYYFSKDQPMEDTCLNIL